MFKDPKIQLAIGAFILFFTLWMLLAFTGKAPFDPIVAFIGTACATVYSLILVFIKPDGGTDKPKDAQDREPAP